MTEWWTAFGSIATAAGSIATAVGLFLTAIAMKYAAGQLAQSKQAAEDAKKQAQLAHSLTTMGILFEYYNAKISSLSVATSEGRDVDKNKAKREGLLAKHNALLEKFESHYGKELESA